MGNIYRLIFDLPDWLQWSIVLFSIIFFFIVGFIVVKENGKPSKTIAWLLIIIIFPVIGFLLYLQFGLNFRKRKLYKLKRTKDIQRYHDIIEEEYDQFETSDWFELPEVRNNRRLAKLLLKSSKSLFSHHNDVTPLFDGKDTFESLFRDLEKAKEHIHIQFYILHEGDLADRLLEIFKMKIAEGVEIRLLYDAVGSWSLGKEYRQKLTEIGVTHHEFMPVRFAVLGNRVNYRNHRKIVVIDATIAYTGGINVDDKYIYGNELGHWRDTFVRIEGNAVNGLQFLFLSDWYFASGVSHLDRSKFKVVERTTGCPVQIVGSGPDSDYAGIMQEYTSMINLARNYIYISNPYLIPGEVILNALLNAAMGGVDVRILIPGISDYRVVKWSTNSYLEDLLRAGVRIFKYHGGFLHEKVMVMDDEVSSIGTANMDIRSFELNFEVNALIYSSQMAIRMKEKFELDCQTAEEIDYQEFLKRPFKEKILESTSRLMSPLL